MESRTSKNVKVIRIGLIALAAAMILLGLWRQENTTVMTKAVNICLECIGIG